MRIVDRPYAKPMRCAALPYIGQTAAVRWVDTGSHLDGPDDHVYLSEPAVTEAARMFGWQPPGEIRSRDNEIARLRSALAAMTNERDELQQAWRAIDVIESRDFTTRRKPGRPRLEKEPA
jgi:hypothetical protein